MRRADHGDPQPTTDDCRRISRWEQLVRVQYVYPGSLVLAADDIAQLAHQ
jgi:hypothetical protein